jgi:UMF1 family MFS transporter
MAVRNQRAWIIYGWANSAYALPVLAAFFPILFSEYWGRDLSANAALSWLGAANSWAGLSVAVLSPFAAALASTSGRRKSYLIVWALVSIGATMALSGVGPGMWAIALGIFVLSQTGFQLSVLFYDTLLHDVSTAGDRHMVSAKGFAYGYLGGVILFIINIGLTLFHTSLPVFDTAQEAQKFALFCAGMWWCIFALPLFTSRFTEQTESLPRKRFHEVIRLLRHDFSIIRADRDIFFFLVAYWFYINGVLTIISMSSGVALSLGVNSTGIITALIFVQFVAFPFSIIAGKCAGRGRARAVLTVIVCMYAVLVFLSGFYLRDARSFFVLALFVGMLQGGAQALSRSYFLSIIPSDRQTSFFGIYSMVGRFSMVLGPALISALTYGIGIFLHERFFYTLVLSRSMRHWPMRMGFSSIFVFFVCGAFFLLRIRKKG